jgi:hypothetical protein
MIVKDRPFPDRSIKPTEQSLQAVLGSACTYYNKIMVLEGSFSQDWTFTKSSGWILKLFDRKKALLYLIPLNGGFRVSLTIRADERAAFLHDEELGIMHAKISSAKKYPEGFALQFDITDRNGFQPFELFLRKLIALRA